MRPSDIRKQILKQRKVEFKRLSRKPVTFDEFAAPYHKTSLMRLLELKEGKKLDDIIFSGTIYELEQKYHVDATTISKWRKLIIQTKEKEFWKNFAEEKELDGERLS